MIMAAKKEGRDIPNTAITSESLSNNESFFTAQITPITTPIISANVIAVNASIAVFGNASASISVTFRLL